MELSNPKIKTYQEEAFRARKISYISGNGTFLPQAFF